MKRYHKRWIQLVIILIFTTIGYKIYKLDLYRWTCENEPNKAACYMLGSFLKEDGKFSEGKYYLEKSCKMGYERACNKLKE